MTLNILAFESSCDECAISLVSTERSYKQLVLSQMDHAEYAGVVPEVAARAHLLAIEPLFQNFITTHNIQPSDIHAIAATCGPGLMGGLLVGGMFAKGLALGWKKPFIPVNHLEGHLLSPRLDPGVDFPYLAMLVSGGHCQLVSVKGWRQYKVIASTLDDAAGEAFDKIARILDLGFPGGPAVERAAKNGDCHTYDLPSPRLKPRDGNPFPLSFSGLKTAVARLAESLPNKTESVIANIAASAQKAIVDQLVWCVEKGLQEGDWKGVVVVGGVAANQALREKLSTVVGNIPFVAPPLSLCTDNAAMIGWAACEQLLNDPRINEPDFPIRPRWPLEALNITPLINH